LKSLGRYALERDSTTRSRARAMHTRGYGFFAPTDDSTFESIDRSIVPRRPQSTTRRWTRRRCERRRDANEPAVERDGAMGVDRRDGRRPSRRPSRRGASLFP